MDETRRDGEAAPDRKDPGLAVVIRRRWRRLLAGFLRLLLRIAPVERRRLLILTVLIGITCGFAAVAFHVALSWMEDQFASLIARSDGYSWIAWLLIIPTVGGLICGILLERIPEARGSGVPEIKGAYATEETKIPLKVVIGKFFISLLQIGSGASLGREGPTVLICAGIASMFGRAGALSKKAMRRMLPVGTAAGIAAAFNAPIAAVTFAIEEIVGDLDQAVLGGVVIAAALAAAIERSVLGVHPILQITHQYTLEHTASLLLYALLGVIAAVASVLFTDSLLNLRLRFRAMKRIPSWARPGIGGLITGALAVIAILWVGVNGITGGGYATLAVGLSGKLALRVLIVLAGAKLVATVFSYASGGSGGIFAPSLFIGGMIGGAVGYIDEFLLGSADQVGAYALVGMGAVFAGIIRAPITSVLIIFEMTSGYSLILPLMVANMTAYALATRWRPTPIYEALLQQDGILIPHPNEAQPLSRIPVGAVMTTRAVLIDPDSTVEDALERIASHEYAIYPVVDKDSNFVGLIHRIRLLQAVEDGKSQRAVRDYISLSDVLGADTPLNVAVVKLHRGGVHLLPVVENEESRHFIGLLTSTDVIRAQAQATREPEAPVRAIRKGI